jgi:small neutral amino acid transporter SnatA (MarC family)
MGTQMTIFGIILFNGSIFCITFGVYNNNIPMCIGGIYCLILAIAMVSEAREDLKDKEMRDTLNNIKGLLHNIDRKIKDPPKPHDFF